MSDTPRTDEAEKPTDGDYYLDGTVPSEHARILERENTALRAHAERLAEALEHYIAIVPPRDTDGDEKWHKARQALTLYRAENPKV